MENHSGLRPDQVHDKPLFESFHDIPETWFRQKAEPVFELKTRPSLFGNKDPTCLSLKTIARSRGERQPCTKTAVLFH